VDRERTAVVQLAQLFPGIDQLQPEEKLTAKVLSLFSPPTPLSTTKCRVEGVEQDSGRTPVIYLMTVLSDVQSSKRILYPTSWPDTRGQRDGRER
jgi:hypothetical protein